MVQCKPAGTQPKCLGGNLLLGRCVAWSMSAVADPTPAPLPDGLEAALQDVLAALPPDASASPRPGRPPAVSATLLWTGLLVCVLRGFTAQSSLWQLLVLRGLWTFPRVNVTPQAIYDRLKHAPLEPLWELFGPSDRRAPHPLRRPSGSARSRLCHADLRPGSLYP
jgi:hypothetical protein